MTQLSKLFVFCTLLLAPMLSYADDWAWSVTPYVWATRVTMDTGVDQIGGVVEFDDILDDLDFALQVHVEARKDRFGLLLDFTNLQSSGRKTHGSLEIDTDVSTFIIEAGATYALSDDPRHLELLAGIRSFAIDLEVELESTGPVAFYQRESEKETLVDAMIGLRYIWPLNDKFTFAVRGDVATGDTDFTWNAAATLLYQVRENRTLQLAYKHLDVGLDEVGHLDPEIEMSGPAIGFTYQF